LARYRLPALQRRKEKHHDASRPQAGKVTQRGRQEPLCPFGQNEYDRDDCGRERGLLDGPADAQIDVEQLRTQDAVGNFQVEREKWNVAQWVSVAGVIALAAIAVLLWRERQ
jgi:hypothetical protein